MGIITVIAGKTERKLSAPAGRPRHRRTTRTELIGVLFFIRAVTRYNMITGTPAVGILDLSTETTWVSWPAADAPRCAGAAAGRGPSGGSRAGTTQ